VYTTGSSFARLPGRPAPSTRPLSPPGLPRTLAKARTVPRCPQHGRNRPASRRLACSASCRFGRFPHRHRSAGYAAWFNRDSPKRWRRRGRSCSCASTNRYHFLRHAGRRALAAEGLGAHARARRPRAPAHEVGRITRVRVRASGREQVGVPSTPWRLQHLERGSWPVSFSR